MSRRFSIFFSCAFTATVLIFYIFNRRSVHQFEESNELDLNISQILKFQRHNIRHDMHNFIFPNGRLHDLDALTMETGGNPIRTIIVATWRSGSTFLGDLLKSIPGSYYFFEPFLDSGLHRYHKADNLEERQFALRHLKKLLSCDFNDMDSYLALGEKKRIVFSHNHDLWKYCKLNSSQYCQNKEFMNQFCKIYPFITMKTVRLGLDLAQMLLLERDLNIRILILIRDPRGTMHSREYERFCRVGPNCDSPRRLCKGLMDDYKVAKELSLKFPLHFKSIRYEDLSLNLYNKTGDIFKFLGLPFHPKVRKFLETHTKNKAGNSFSTHRNTSVTPFHWMMEMDMEYIRQIEQICADALDVWGYRIASNDMDYHEEKTESVLYRDYEPFK